MPTSPQVFAVIPAWAMPDAPRPGALFEAIRLAGFEGKSIRLDAATQRALMGYPVFGKLELRVNACGTVTATRRTAFGLDYERCEYAAWEIRDAAAASKKLSPGMRGPAYAL